MILATRLSCGTEPEASETGRPSPGTSTERDEKHQYVPDGLWLMVVIHNITFSAKQAIVISMHICRDERPPSCL